jgi:alpha-D-ribose 1-methylphosphonate 5-triphosphate synthase subunit PhnL
VAIVHDDEIRHLIADRVIDVTSLPPRHEREDN